MSLGHGEKSWISFAHAPLHRRVSGHHLHAPHSVACRRLCSITPLLATLCVRRAAQLPAAGSARGRRATSGSETESSSREAPKSPGKSSRNDSSKWFYLIQRLFEDMAKVSASRRRDFTYWAVLAGAVGLAIISDFLGLMRFLLSLSPDGARRAGLDQIYPVNGLKAFQQKGKYHLQYPGDWLGDESVAFSKQAARFRPFPFDGNRSSRTRSGQQVAVLLQSISSRVCRWWRSVCLQRACKPCWESPKRLSQDSCPGRGLMAKQSSWHRDAKMGNTNLNIL